MPQPPLPPKNGQTHLGPAVQLAVLVPAKIAAAVEAGIIYLQAYEPVEGDGPLLGPRLRVPPKSIVRPRTRRRPRSDPFSSSRPGSVLLSCATHRHREAGA